MTRPQHAPGAMIARAFGSAPKPEQLPLTPRRELLTRYEVGAPFAPKSDTSREAAEQIRPQAANLRESVLRAMLKTPGEGATAEEIEELTGLAGNTVRPRLIELVERGQIAKTDRKRATRSGRNAVIYVVTSAGRGLLAGRAA
jgi:hypothetical protein